MKRFSIFLPIVLSACMSTADDPIYRQVNWTNSDEYKVCKDNEDKEQADYQAARAAHEKAQSNYDYEAELKDYEAGLKNFEQQMAEFEAGERKFMPLRPPVIRSVIFGPRLPVIGKCFKVPDDWASK